MTEVNWVAEGFEGLKLAYLAMGAGFFYDRHRAANDCLAAIELLAVPLPQSGEIAMSQLLASARRVTLRIWAEGAPFEYKDELKRRGYRWSGDAGLRPRTWYRGSGSNGCARRSWRGPAGGSPARVRRSEPPGSECCRSDR